MLGIIKFVVWYSQNQNQNALIQAFFPTQDFGNFCLNEVMIGGLTMWEDFFFFQLLHNLGNLETLICSFFQFQHCFYGIQWQYHFSVQNQVFDCSNLVIDCT
eukprot:TRINITY_DN6521_c0_g1_i8.p3 TRINITY_DN6521_c0_g1~~TRINITY_DN6521_c0_g1_i8.p3  ORF type:complete len:102 (-),score=1.96 TRINITY_DN6521_c0_g1_i8:242-547(-)